MKAQGNSGMWELGGARAGAPFEAQLMESKKGPAAGFCSESLCLP